MFALLPCGLSAVSWLPASVAAFGLLLDRPEGCVDGLLPRSCDLGSPPGTCAPEVGAQLPGPGQGRAGAGASERERFLDVGHRPADEPEVDLLGWVERDGFHGCRCAALDVGEVGGENHVRCPLPDVELVS